MAKPKVFLWESQREYARCLADLQAHPIEIAAIFDCSDAAVRDALGGQRATTKMRDLTGGVRRYPSMTRTEYEGIVMLAERQFRQHPLQTVPFDRLCRLLAATYEDVVQEQAPPAVFETGMAGVLDRIADSYTALGEQIVQLVDAARADRRRDIELAVREVLGEHLPALVAHEVEEYFS